MKCFGFHLCLAYCVGVASFIEPQIGRLFGLCKAFVAATHGGGGVKF